MRGERLEIVAMLIVALLFVAILVVWDWVVVNYLGGWGDLWKLPREWSDTPRH